MGEEVYSLRIHTSVLLACDTLARSLDSFVGKEVLQCDPPSLEPLIGRETSRRLTYYAHAYVEDRLHLRQSPVSVFVVSLALVLNYRHLCKSRDLARSHSKQ